jgi:peptidoglycan hydrolase FlgJ
MSVNFDSANGIVAGATASANIKLSESKSKDFASQASSLSQYKMHNNKTTHQAATEFYSLFLSQMLNIMFEQIEVNPLFGGGVGESTYRSMLVDEYAATISKRDDLGIVKMIESQLARLYNVKMELEDGEAYKSPDQSSGEQNFKGQ